MIDSLCSLVEHALSISDRIGFFEKIFARYCSSMPNIRSIFSELMNNQDI
jgi:hypothetical protein